MSRKSLFRSFPGARWRTLAALCAFALCFVAVSCARPNAAPIDRPNPALWRITDEDSEIFLFGTVHMLPADLKWRSDRVSAAFRAADVVYLETPIDDAAARKLGALFAEYGAAPADQPLSRRLSREDAAMLERAADKLALDETMRVALERTRPWFAALQLSLLAARQQGFEPEAGVERTLDREAKRLGKPLAYLETNEEQVRFWAELPKDVEDRYFRATLEEIVEGGEDHGDMNRAWASGDVATLEALLDRSFAEVGPEFVEALLYERNEDWASDIDRLMQGSGSAFIAVGAAHLTGEKNVPDLLRAQGYVVEGP